MDKKRVIAGMKVAHKAWKYTYNPDDSDDVFDAKMAAMELLFGHDVMNALYTMYHFRNYKGA